MSTPLKIFFMFFVPCMILHAGGCYTSTSFTGDVADMTWLDDGSAPEEIIAEPDRAERVDMPPDPPIEHEADGIDLQEDPVIEDIVEDLPEEEPPPAAVLWSDDYEDDEIEWVQQQGAWAVADGRLNQYTDMMSELWYPGRTWDDVAVEVSVSRRAQNTAGPRDGRFGKRQRLRHRLVSCIRSSSGGAGLVSGDDAPPFAHTVPLGPAALSPDGPETRSFRQHGVNVRPITVR